MDILGKRYIFFAISLLVIVPGLIVLGTDIANNILPLSIDFTGGSFLEAKFSAGKAPQPAEVVILYKELGISDVQAQTSGADVIIVRSSFLDETQRVKVIATMTERFKDKVTVNRFDSVGPTVGQEVALRAVGAVLVAAIIVIFYITFAFRGIPHAFRYGVCAIIAMAHDVAVVFSIVALGGKFLDWQIDALFLTALLTVIGFSVQDKIVVFDRIRENSRLFRRATFESLVNHSIIQTLQRSINTQLMTVEFMLLALAMFGGVTLREFAVILLVGLFSGTYSSIFTAASLLVVWENQEWGRLFGRKSEAAA
jgi:preprotein translocase subunit SecF